MAEEGLVDGAPRLWNDYPEPQAPYHQVLPYGMWPWESQKGKAARAGAPYEGAAAAIAAALGEQLAASHPETAQHVAANPTPAARSRTPAPPTQH
jgi:hypothetical protein